MENGQFGFSSSPVTYPRTFATPDDPVLRPSAYGFSDNFSTNSLDPRWTRRNVLTTDVLFPSWLSYGVQLNFDASGDNITIPAPSGDFEIVMSIVGHADFGGMFGPIAVDSSGNGIGFSMYNNPFNFFTWSLVNYSYNATGNSIAGSLITGKMYWIALKKSGTSYTGRWSQDGTTWATPTAAHTFATALSKIGIGRCFTNGQAFYYVTRFNVYFPSYVV